MQKSESTSIESKKNIVTWFCTGERSGCDDDDVARGEGDGERTDRARDCIGRDRVAMSPKIGRAAAGRLTRQTRLALISSCEPPGKGTRRCTACWAEKICRADKRRPTRDHQQKESSRNRERKKLRNQQHSFNCRKMPTVTLVREREREREKEGPRTAARASSARGAL